MRHYYLLALISVCLLTAGCNSRSKDNRACPEGSTVAMPAFDCDSAYGFVAAQTAFGPRVPGSDAHVQCALYLLHKLSQYCDTAHIQTFPAVTYDGKHHTGKNIIGSFSPEKSERVVLSSHWDSRPFADHDATPSILNKPIDGANDGASGVGVLLETARQLQMQRPEIGIDIVLFDLEDYGPKEGETAPDGDWWGLGSQYWAQHLHRPGYMARYGILLDMVGAADARFYQESFSVRDAQPVVAKVWSAAYELGHGNYFINQPGGIITDDHYYVNKYAPFKMIDIIHYDRHSGTGFPSTWHTLNDNIQNIDRTTLGVVGTTVLHVIRNEK